MLYGKIISAGMFYRIIGCHRRTLRTFNQLVIYIYIAKSNDSEYFRNSVLK
jgi:hypothetical protein